MVTFRNEKKTKTHTYIRKSIKILSANYRFRDGIMKIGENFFFDGDFK